VAQFLSGRMPFLSRNQQCQSTEGNSNQHGLILSSSTWCQ